MLRCASELAERCPVKAEVGGQRITRLCMLRCASELAERCPVKVLRTSFLP